MSLFDQISDDARRHAPATERNREPILSLLRDLLPAGATVLEIASGTGEHAVYFAERLPGVTWLPSDPDPDLRASTAAWAAASGADVRAPLDIDTTADVWPVERADAILCINMIHIAPWTAAEGLFRGAGTLLPEDGILFLYGPFRIDGRHTAPSNEAFDESLRRRDPSWGVRDVEEVAALGDRYGLDLANRVEMPANNLSLIFRRRSRR